MRVTIVTSTPPTIPSGSGTFVATEQLARGLEARGHTVRLVRPAHDPERWPGFTVRRLAFNARLRAPAVARDADLVVGFDLDGWRVAGHSWRPFVAYLHGVLADEARFERGLVRWGLGLQARAERTTARCADLVLSTSEYSRQRITDLYGVHPSKIRVVRPGIDLSRWEDTLNRSDGPPTRRPGGPAVNQHTILSVAHMYPRKNLAALIRATALLARDVPNVRVRLVGDGPQRGTLERLSRVLGLEGTITFLGHVPFATLAAEYAACTLFCLPTLQEGFGLVFAEAMAAGKPVVALAASSTPELVTDGEHGYLVPPGDDAALAAALHRLLTDPGAAERMGRAGRARVGALSLDHMAQQFLDAVEPLVSRTPGVAPGLVSAYDRRPVTGAS
ncbi:MAG: glycosyltransferase family 4 protein [Gemmatimonadetes bacterium]|nr:glycosyltransferase family 4 protein [Gemmatimonadota bacterium]